MTLLDTKQGQGYIARVESNSPINGEGVRCSAYISGYPFNCAGCYNKASQEFRYGEKYTDKILAEILDGCNHDYISGLSLLGNELFCNLDITLSLVKVFRAHFGNAKTTWVWTGSLYEYLVSGCTERQELLSYIGVLVDGPFAQHSSKPDLLYKGSLDQRIIDVQQPSSHTHMVEYIVGRIYIRSQSNIRYLGLPLGQAYN